MELRGAVGELSDAIEAGELPPEALFVGAAGTGKTFGILLLLHLLSLRRPGMRILICRKTRAALTESVLVTYEKEVLPITGHESIADGVKRQQRQNYQYPNGTEWIVGGLDKPNKILSTSYDIVFPNEAIELTEEDWETLQSRIGRPDRAHRLNAIIGDTNPGDPAHWLKRRCNEGVCKEYVSHHADNPGLYDDEADDWTEAGASYLLRLKRLTGTRRRRLLEGLWAAGEGQWFSTFDPDRHVIDSAEFDPRYPVHLSVDTGVHTGGAWWQLQGTKDDPILTVFADYYNYGTHAFENARNILAVTAARCGRVDVGRYDPSGGAQAGFGGTTIASEYQRAGLHLHPWPKFSGCITAGLTLLESFVAVDPVRFRVHPRCTRVIDGMVNYKRKKRGANFIDEPEDDQHPFSEAVDPIRSGLLDKFPQGRLPEPGFRYIQGRRAI